MQLAKTIGMTAWACPNCGRRVPNHVDTCRCGVAREHAPAAVSAPVAEVKSSGRRVMGLSTGVLGGILGFFLVKTVMSSGLGSGSTVSLEELTKTADRLNRMLPMMVDR